MSELSCCDGGCGSAAAAQTLKRTLRTSPSWTTYSLPSRRCRPRRAASARLPASTRSRQLITSQRMKPAGDVGVNCRGGIESCRALLERPRARLRVAAGEEGEEPDGLEEPRQDGVEARRPVAELGRLLRRQLGELGLELEVEPSGPVDHSDQWLRRQRFQLGRKRRRGRRSASCPASTCARTRSSWATSSRSLGSPDFACVRTRSRRFSTWSRSATTSSSWIVSRSCSGSASGPKARRTAIRASAFRSSPRTGALSPGGSTTLTVAGVVFCGALDGGDRLQPLVGDGRDADVLLAVRAAGHAGEGGEERRLSGPRQAYESNFERHLDEGTADLLPARSACPRSGPVEGVWGNREVPPATLPSRAKSARVCPGFVPSLRSRYAGATCFWSEASARC